ncbi:MAG: group II intron reverse transcriptase/maturase [Acidobacteriales bacterium]|nr:group II intron reverse transcriptase/maturase [Terriglobales bacterium]
MIAPKAKPTPKEKVRQLQRALYRAAKANRERTFGVLYDKVWRQDVLLEATRRVVSNRGGPGVDEQTVAALKAYGVERFITETQEELRLKRYRPDRVLRHYIRKANGTMRPLGIPTLKDRIIQMAVKLVIEPLFEADFQACSFGFRPKKSAPEATQMIRYVVKGGAKWVLDVDLKSYFDTIPHDKLMILVQERVTDVWTLRLIRWWLKAGVLEDGQVTTPALGSPQGGVISPLLSNVYLNLVDRIWVKRGYQDRHNGWEGTLVRYADDMVVLCRTEEAARFYKGQLANLLGRMELSLNEEKTQTVRVKEGFNFLGIHHREAKSWSGRPFSLAMPSAKAMVNVRAKIKDTIKSQGLQSSLNEVIATLNPVLRGWSEYFRRTNAARSFQDIDRYTSEQLHLWMCRKHASKWALRSRGIPVQLFHKAGLLPLSKRITQEGSFKSS